LFVADQRARVVDLVGSTLLFKRLVVAATLALFVADHRARVIDLVGGDALDFAMNRLVAAAAVPLFIANVRTWVNNGGCNIVGMIGMVRDICVLYTNFGGRTSREVT